MTPSQSKVGKGRRKKPVSKRKHSKSAKRKAGHSTAQKECFNQKRILFYLKPEHRIPEL